VIFFEIIARLVSVSLVRWMNVVLQRENLFTRISIVTMCEACIGEEFLFSKMLLL